MGRDLISGVFPNSKQESYLVIRDLWVILSGNYHLSPPHLYCGFGRSGRMAYQIMSPQEMA